MTSIDKNNKKEEDDDKKRVVPKPTKKGRSRPVRGSAKIIFKKGLYPDLRSAVREMISNAMSWMHVADTPEELRKVYIALNEDGFSLTCEDFGIGVPITQYDDFCTMGHESTDGLHNERMKDPDFISMIGIGINSYLSLSKSEHVEFYSVSQDERGRKTGLIANMWGTPDDIEIDDIPWTGDPREALNHVGLKVVIKDCKQVKELTKKELVDYIGKTFALKLKEYPVFIRDFRTDLEFERIIPSQEFCTKHITTLFKLSDGIEVRGDIHTADNQLDSKICMCIKKIKIEVRPTKYLAHGIITTDSQNVKFQANRGGFQRDEESLFPELEQKMEEWLAENGFELPAPQKERTIKGEKGLKEMAGDSIMKLLNHDKYRDVMLRISGSLSKLGIPSSVTMQKNEDNEWELYAHDQMVILTDKKPEATKILRGPRKKKGKKTKKKDDDNEDHQHEDHTEGGDRTVKKQKKKQPNDDDTRIIPDMKIITKDLQQVLPVSDIVEIDGMIKWRINTRSSTGEMIIGTNITQNQLLKQVCFNKALSDFVAKQECLSWLDASELWEYLQSG